MNPQSLSRAEPEKLARSPRGSRLGGVQVISESELYAAVAALRAAGATIFPCRPFDPDHPKGEKQRWKDPIGLPKKGGRRDYWHTLELAEHCARLDAARTGLPGIVPGTLSPGFLVLDVDTDTAADLAGALAVLEDALGPPWRLVATSHFRPHRRHAWYGVDPGDGEDLTAMRLGQKKQPLWRYGETRCTDGFVCLHGAAAAVLAEALQAPPRDRVTPERFRAFCERFPHQSKASAANVNGAQASLLAGDGAQSASECDSGTRATGEGARSRPRSVGRGAALPALAHEGNRNNTLNTEAFKAAKRGEDRADAYAMLRDVCTLEPAEFDRTFESGWTAGQAERGWNGRRANGDARGSTGVDSSPREGSDTDLNAVPLDALSEGVFARAWAEAHGPDEFLYAKGEGWLRYRSGRWRDGECAARQSMSEMIMGKIEGTELAKRFDTHRVVCGSLSMVEYRRTVPVQSFDPKSLLVPFPDGTVLDVESGAERPARPQDRIRKVLAASPGPCVSSKWVEFVDQALSHYSQDERSEIAAYVQEWCGIALTGDCRDEAALFLWGDTGCGKSTFFETFLAVLGNLGTTVSGKRVAGDREDHRQWLARLQGRRLVVINELPEKGRWNTEDLNSLIDGGPIEANRMRQDSEEFTSQAHVLITGNHRPNAAAASGIWRRLRVLELRHKPQVEDVALKEQLRRELPGVLRWCLGGLQRWAQRERLPKVPAVVEAGVEQYRAASDPIAQFIKECTVPDPKGRIEVAALHDAFTKWWLAEAGDHVPSKRALGVALDDLGWSPSVVIQRKKHRVGHRLI